MKRLATVFIVLLIATVIYAAYSTANYHEEGGAKWVIGGGGLTGQLLIDSNGSLVYEGATADDYETTVAVTDPTADRTITYPDATGKVLVSGVTALAASTTLTANQCYGTVFTNTAIADSTVNLPVAVVGMKVTFINTDVNDITINPQNDASIICNGLTPSAGDAISSDKALGSSVTLVATSTTQWAVIGKIGTWSDAN